MPSESSLKDADWNILLKRIMRGACTPVLGPGATSSSLRSTTEIAQELAEEYDYPLADSDNLARVLQFIQFKSDRATPREEMVERLKNVTAPNFKEPDEPQGLLAELPLSVYLTTNYDNFMVRALQKCRMPREPRVDFCRWNEDLTNQESIFDGDYRPTPANPLVFHMHGYTGEPDSLVLTEDDYLNFLVNTSNPSRPHTLSQRQAIPPTIESAFTQSWLLFIGYHLEDFQFRVLLRSMLGFLQKNTMNHLSVHLLQMDDSCSQEKVNRIREYLSGYYNEKPLRIKVYWGTTSAFIEELRQRWEAFEQTEDAQKVRQDREESERKKEALNVA